MDLAAVRGLLRLGMVPVLYGVPAYDEERGCSILSGDELTVFLARGLGASRVIHGVDVDGVYTDDPKANPQAELIKIIDEGNVDAVLAALARSSKPDATGGILNKVSKLVELAKAGVECEIVNAAKPGVVARALRGERGLGTLIKF
jgi:isopentenyl phosphate kinase